MHKEKIISGIKNKDRGWVLSIASVIGLVMLMLAYLVMTVWSSSELVRHTDVISGHPFEVVTSAGDIQTYLSEMRVRTERLVTHSDPSDITLVYDALEELYGKLEEPLDKVSELYLGDVEDISKLQEAITQLRVEQEAYLEFAAQTDNQAEIEAYQDEQLYPLYRKVGQQLEDIIQSAQKTKAQYGETSELLQQKMILGAVVLMSLIIMIVFLMSQYILRRQRQELIIRSQLFDNLSNSIDDAFLIRDAETGEVSYTSLNMERVTGYAIKRLDDIYRGFNSDDGAAIQTAIRNQEFPFLKTVEYTRPDREKRWMSVRIYRTEHMQRPQVISVLSDCTDEIKSRQALRDAMLNAKRANAAKSDFLSRMSHEIRTPLNAIIGMTTIAAASAQDQGRVEDCLTKINFSSKHLLMLINDVLDMSKIESDKMSLQEEPFDLSQIINSFASTIYAQAQAKGVAFSEVMEGFGGNTQYVGDGLRLNQILLNLGSNAVKFTPPGGEVVLTVSRIASKQTTDTVRFVVRDTGIGMTAEALERIFKPFEQADATISSRYGGTGLGMSITQNLVTLMSGRIGIKSEPGVGTVCTVDLPLVRDEEAKPQPDFGNMGLRALVVDDEQAVCVETASLLEKIRIVPEWVTTGAEAVERVARAQREDRSFDFCLVDWKMPDMNGVEVTRSIRDCVGFDLPIIMISAYDFSDFEDEARAAGANAFLPKPLYRSSVYAAIQSALGCDQPTEQVQPSCDAALEGRRLLVAEDNELNREIVVELLHMSGMEAECAVDGAEAVRMFQEADPGYFDAILMDVQMPVMDGYEATRRIRSSGKPDAGRIPIIATTANAFSDDISAALAAGMDAHVSKPIDMEQLRKVLAEKLGAAERV